MSILPSKQQYKKWTLPSKYGLWGLVIGIVGLLLMLVFEWWPTSNKIAVDNTKKAVEEIKIAKNDKANGNLLGMLNHASKAFEYTNAIEEREFLGLALILNKKADSAFNLLFDYRDKLSVGGKWLLATTLSSGHKASNAMQWYDHLTLETIPADIEMEALKLYIEAAASISYEKFKTHAQNVITHVNNRIDRSLTPTRIEPIASSGETQVPTNDITPAIYLPAIYFKIGVTWYFIRQFHDKIFYEDDLLPALFYMERGFTSGMMTQNSSDYLAFFQHFKENNFFPQCTQKGKIVASLNLFKLHLQNALKGDIWLGETLLGMKFNQSQLDDFKKCIDFIDSTLPENFEQLMTKADRIEIDKQIQSQERYEKIMRQAKTK